MSPNFKLGMAVESSSQEFAIAEFAADLKAVLGNKGAVQNITFTCSF